VSETKAQVSGDDDDGPRMESSKEEKNINTNITEVIKEVPKEQEESEDDLKVDQ
jgi:hypothetical protein